MSWPWGSALNLTDLGIVLELEHEVVLKKVAREKQSGLGSKSLN